MMNIAGGALVLGSVAFVYKHFQHGKSVTKLLFKHVKERGSKVPNKGPLSVVPSVAPRELSKMSVYERSYILAELSCIAYENDIDRVAETAKQFGFKSIEMYREGSNECFRFTSDYETVVACRGTETSGMGDIITDLRLHRVDASCDACSCVPGKVHRGFKVAAYDLWNAVRDDVLAEGVAKGHKIWFTGHSLGAAIATIMATYSHHDAETIETAGLITFGSPRVGNQEFSGFNDKSVPGHYRWVNNEDAVTKSPMNLFGIYSHCGTQMYLQQDEGFCLHDCSWRRAFVDRMSTRFSHLMSCKKATDLSDHSMDTGYVRKLKALVDKEKLKLW